MKKLVTLSLAALMVVTFASFGAAEDITLDVLIAQSGPNTQNWVLGDGMDGSNFVKKFEEVGIEVPTTWAELEDACQAIVDFYGGEVYPWGIDMTTDEGQAAFAYYA